MALYISLRDFRVASLAPGDHEKDERLDRSVLVVALGVVGGGMAFLLGMVFLLFPEWIRPIAFAPGLSESRVHVVLVRPHAATDKGRGLETPFYQAQARNFSIDRSVRFQNTAQTPSGDQTVSVSSPPRGQASAEAPPPLRDRGLGRVADDTASQPAVQPPANAQPVAVPNTGTRSQQGQSNTANPRSEAAVHGSGKKRA